jgi:hypothetical protein
MAITREELVGAFTPASSVSRERERNQREEGDDMRVPPVGEGKRGIGYRFGFELGGLRADSSSGPKRFPGVRFYFYFLFPLFFFCFLYFFIPFSNLNQIDSNQKQSFLKFKTTIQDSNKQVFINKTTFYKNHMKWPRIFICIKQIKFGF